ncbi:MAG TPA: proton extrusion protein PcxA [Candidatus Sericytochromatia bacterium]
MQTTLWTRLKQSLGAARQWYEQTPERALDQAYAAALMIQAIEDEHFDGKPISTETAKYGANSKAVFQEELRKCLKIATLRLSEFKASRFIFNTADTSGNARQGAASLANSERAAVILEKLKFIDTVIEKYQPEKAESVALVPVNQTGSVSVAQNGKPQLAIGAKSNTGSQRLSNGQTIDQLYKGEPAFDDDDDDTGIFDKSGVLPRTIASTLGRIKRDLDPNSEQKVVQSFRSNKVKTRTSIRFLLILITVPLLVQQISKTVLIGPIVDRFRSSESANPFLNFELQETALRELHMFRERMEFDFLLGKAPSLHSDVLGDPLLNGAAAEEEQTTGELSRPLTRAEQEERIEAKLRERAEEIKLEYSRSGSEAIKNIFGDLCSLIAFAIVLIMNRREVAILKSFIDDTVYGLSDSAKAFIIILFTDMFVGFHSPHGWEVLLEGLSKHWGLPANQSFIFLFIATFPVVLDTIFKYWIFRYLNRISPSAVATYKTMNE